jgi:hypothetical protein
MAGYPARIVTLQQQNEIVERDGKFIDILGKQKSSAGRKKPS